MVSADQEGAITFFLQTELVDLAISSSFDTVGYIAGCFGSVPSLRSCQANGANRWLAAERFDTIVH